MVTLWLPVAKKAGDREVVLKIRKDCKYRGVTYQADVALEVEPLEAPPRLRISRCELQANPGLVPGHSVTINGSTESETNAFGCG